MPASPPRRARRLAVVTGLARPDGTTMAITEARGPTCLWDVARNRN